MSKYLWGSLKVAPVDKKVISGRLSWYGHVMRREERYITRRRLDMSVEGYKGSGRLKKRYEQEGRE